VKYAIHFSQCSNRKWSFWWSTLTYFSFIAKFEWNFRGNFSDFSGNFINFGTTSLLYVIFEIVHFRFIYCRRQVATYYCRRVPLATLKNKSAHNGLLPLQLEPAQYFLKWSNRDELPYHHLCRQDAGILIFSCNKHANISSFWNYFQMPTITIADYVIHT